jgi:hypothetical protein
VACVSSTNLSWSFMPIKLRIPDAYASSLAEFLRLSPEELAAFLGALRDEKPTLRESDLARSIEGRLSLGGTKVREIVRLLASLYVAQDQTEEEVGDFVVALRSAAESSGKDDLQPADWTAYQNAIIEALSSDTALAVAAKAADVMNDHAKVYCHARILTDLRPIFESNVEQAPAALVIIHTLKIVYHEEGEHKEFFVALDSNDVLQLADLLDRAFKKEDSLKALCAAKEITFLEAS